MDSDRIHKERKRHWHLLRKYGVTLRVWKRLLIAQDHVCPICHGPLKGGKNSVTDHNHDTGRVRGIIHRKCNTALGLLKDGEDPEIFDRCKKYVTRYD